MIGMKMLPCALLAVLAVSACNTSGPALTGPSTFYIAPISARHHEWMVSVDAIYMELLGRHVTYEDVMPHWLGPEPPPVETMRAVVLASPEYTAKTR